MSSRRKRERTDAAAIAADSATSLLHALSIRRTSIQTTPVLNQANNSHQEINKNETKSGDETSRAKFLQNKAARSKVSAVHTEISAKNSKEQPKVNYRQSSSSQDESVQLLWTSPLVDTASIEGEASEPNSPHERSPQHEQIRERTSILGDQMNPSRPPEGRNDRIKDVLSHRRTLLSRIRMCKNAIQSRLDQSTEVSKLLTADNDKQISVANSKSAEATILDEVAQFKEMTRQANQAAKKQRAETNESQHPPGKRISLSLRRGASVGKRMNAALSALAPGGGSSVVLLETNQPSVHLQPVVVITQSNSQILTTGNSSTQLQSLLNNKSTQANSTLPLTVQVVATIQTQDLIQRKKTSTTHVKNNKAAMQARGFAAAVGNVPYQSSQSAPKQPSLVCPEALSARERRRNIREKLSLLYLDRLKKKEESTESPPNPSVRKFHTQQPTSFQEKNKFLIGPNSVDLVKGPCQSVKLPRRRKTQWDYVLEEMCWLSSDFLEERKWKLSAARIISSVISEHASMMSKAKEWERQKLKAKSSAETMYMENDEKKDDEPIVNEKKTPRKRTRDSVIYHTTIQRIFMEPTATDIDVSRNTARAINTLINAAWDPAAISELTFPGTGLDASSGNFKVEGASTKNISPIENATLHVADISPTQSEGTKSEAGMPKTKPGEVVDRTFQDISYSVQAIVEQLGRRLKQRSRRPKKDAKHLSKLSLNQLKIVDFTEYVWSLRDNTGVLIKCTEYSDIEVVRALFLGSDHEGSRLILCPSLRQMEWRNELRSIEDRRILIFEQSGMLTIIPTEGQRNISLTNTDIVIADLTLIDQVAKILNLNSFITVIIDTRATRRMGSRLEWNLTEPPLVSATWWTSTLEKLDSISAKRIMLTSGNQKDKRSESHKSSDVNRQRFNLLCAHVAFVVGPRCFRSSQRGILSRVLSWAKHESKLECGTMKASPEAVELKLSKLLKHLQVLSDPDKNRELSYSSEVRKCQLSDQQRLVYDDCCRQVRSSVSFKLAGYTEESLDRELAAARAIENLRRVCLHSDLSSFSDFEPCSSSSSQPNIEFAQRHLERSAKLRELIVLLKEDCGVAIHGWNLLRQCLTGTTPSNGSETDVVDEDFQSSRNVLIICSSPEGQLMTSRVFRAIGIEHSSLASTIASNKLEKSTQIAHLEWKQFHQKLSKFTNQPHSGQRKCQLLVLSPQTAATAPLAYVVGASDIIICLDEDWSGRGSANVDEIVKHCVTQRTTSNVKEVDVRVIRLVCKNTLEETIAYGIPEGDIGDSRYLTVESANNELNIWSRDATGNFVLCAKEKHNSLESLHNMERAGFVFPAASLLRICHKSLNEALCAGVPQKFGFMAPQTTSFLPFHDFVVNQRIDMSNSSVYTFIRELVTLEERMSLTIPCPVNRLPRERRHIATSIVPPDGSMFPVGLLREQGMPYYPVQFYIDNLCTQTATFQATPSSFTHDSTNTSAVTSLGTNSELVDHWQVDGLTPATISTSLLVYIESSSSIDDVQGLFVTPVESFAAGDVPMPSTIKPTISLKRLNIYAASYARMRVDGVANFASVGNDESRVYFPPLFPGTFLSSKQAQLDVGALQSSKIVKKRKMTPDETLNAVQVVKRPKVIFATQNPSTDEQHSMGFSDLLQLDKSTSHSEVSTYDVLSTTRANQVLDTDGDIGTRSMVSDDESSTNGPVLFLEDTNEDYGLLGVGAYASITFSGHEAAITAMNIPHYLNCPDQHDGTTNVFQPFAASRSEELAASIHKSRGNHSLASVLLFVPRKSAASSFGSSGFSGEHCPSSASQRISNQYLVPESGVDNGIVIDSKSNCTPNSKKPKQSNFSVVGSASLSLLSSETIPKLPVQADILGIIGKSTIDMYRSKAQTIISARKYGFSLFDTAGFRLASVRIRDRVHYRILASEMRRPDFLVDRGAGLDCLSGKPKWQFSPKTNEWTTIAKRMKIQDDSTKQRPSVMVESRSQYPLTPMILPASVDYGPFHTGHCDDPAQPILESLSVVTRSGVSLPMGVKTSTSKLEEHIQSWPAPEDNLLRLLVSKYPDNWYLVARGFVKESTSKKGISTRSPRQCKGRWEKLLKEEPILPNRVCTQDSISTTLVGLGAIQIRGRVSEVETGILSTVAKIRETSLLLPAGDDILLSNGPLDSMEGTLSSSNLPRTFLAFRGAILKKQNYPMTIPGVVAGQKPSIVASHPSHHQSLQAALSSTSSSATEMWPLQILDTADKQRIACRNALAAAPTTHPVASASTSTGRPTSSNKPQSAYPSPPRSRPPGTIAATPSSVSHSAPPAKK